MKMSKELAEVEEGKRRLEGEAQYKAPKKIKAPKPPPAVKQEGELQGDGKQGKPEKQPKPLSDKQVARGSQIITTVEEPQCTLSQLLVKSTTDEMKQWIPEGLIKKGRQLSKHTEELIQRYIVMKTFVCFGSGHPQL